MRYEDKTEAFNLSALSCEGNCGGPSEAREAQQVGAPPSCFEGGSWGRLSTEPTSNRATNRLRAGGRNISPTTSPVGLATDKIQAAFRIESVPVLIATQIIRNRRNSPAISYLIFSNRYKNGQSARIFSSLQTAFSSAPSTRTNLSRTTGTRTADSARIEGANENRTIGSSIQYRSTPKGH